MRQWQLEEVLRIEETQHHYIEQYKDELSVEGSRTSIYPPGTATMDFAYNYDMLCDQEMTMSFDYVRHSRKKRLTYVACPVYSMKNTLQGIKYEIDTEKTKNANLFDQTDKECIFT
jgi:hypothetical protein